MRIAKLLTDLPKMQHLRFKPKEDITTFELARCMSMLMDFNLYGSRGSLTQKIVDDRLGSEGESVSRHWVYE